MILCLKYYVKGIPVKKKQILKSNRVSKDIKRCKRTKFEFGSEKNYRK